MSQEFGIKESTLKFGSLIEIQTKGPSGYDHDKWYEQCWNVVAHGDRVYSVSFVSVPVSISFVSLLGAAR